MIIHKSYLTNIDISQILRVITIRNHIAHKGLTNISSELSDPSHSIRQVLLLNSVLGDAKIQIKYTGDKKEINDSFKKKYKSYLKIWIYRDHTVSIDINLFYGDKEDEDTFLNMIDLIEEKRRKQDKLFNKDMHLKVRFNKFDKGLIAYWEQGKLKNMKNKKQIVK